MAGVAKYIIKKAASAIGARHRALRIESVPHWVTPSDVRRMAERAGAVGLIDVTLEQSKGLPIGSATLEFNSLKQTKRAARILADSTISSIPLQISGFEHGIHPAYIKGKRVDDGYVNEVSKGKSKAPATVVVFGFPAKWELRETRSFLHGYRLDTWGEAAEAYEKLFENGNSSRWAIHLSNMEDAHRLIRHLHMNRFALGNRTDTLLGARILY